MSKQLNTIAPKKWFGYFGGAAPSLDASDGVLVGDIAIDKGDTGNSSSSSGSAGEGGARPLWLCHDNTEGAPVWSALRRLHTAASAPTVNDDSGDGYSAGSRWIDTAADKEYVCLDATVGAAVWTETTSTGGGGISSASDKTADYTVATTDANNILLLTEAAAANATFTLYQLVGAASNQGKTHYFKNRSSYTLTIKGYQKGTDEVEPDSTSTTINAAAHGFAVGQIVHITSGAAAGDKRRILTVTTNSFTISALSADPVPGDTFEVVDGIDDQYSVTLGANEALTLFGNDDQWLRI